MRFYIVANASSGEIFAVYKRLSTARAAIKDDPTIVEYTITEVDVPVNAWAIQALLSNSGGYANSVRQIYPPIP